MNSPRSDEYGVPLLWVNDIQQFVRGAGLAGIVELLRGSFAFESHVDLSIRFGVEDIPYLGLSERVVSLFGDLIVRMNLNGKLLMDVEKLYQKRELTPEPCVCRVSGNPVEIGFHNVPYRIAGKPAVAHERVLLTHVGKFPTLPDEIVLRQMNLVSVLVGLHEVLPKNLNQRVPSPHAP